MITPNTITVDRYIAYAKWVWIIGAILATLLGGALIFLYVGDPTERLVFAITFAFTLAQATLGIIAAINLKPGRNWARITLIILGFLCIVSIYQTIANEMWISLIFNLVLGSTTPVLARKDVKVAFTDQAEIKR